jgi:hypothetical protein
MRLKEPGWVDGITFRNIQLNGAHNGPFVRIQGYNATLTTKNVSLEQVIINGKPITRQSPEVVVGEHTENIRISAERSQQQ